MTILHRLKINHKVLTITESEHSIEVEVAGAKSKDEEKALLAYLEDEAIMDEILSGNLQFASPLEQNQEPEEWGQNEENIP
jgi:hypothetical protein